MSDSCTSRSMCEVLRPPPLPYITGEDLKTIYADNEAYINYTRCCPGYGYSDGPDISKSTTVASASLHPGYIFLILFVLVLLICIIAFIKWKYFNNRQSSCKPPFTKYNTINCLDYKACKLSCWHRTNDPPSTIETEIPTKKSNGVNGQMQEIDIKKLYPEVQRHGGKSREENSTNVENNQSGGRNSSIKSKTASENGGKKVREDTASENGEEKVKEDNASEKWGEKVTEDTVSEKGGEEVRENNACEYGGEMARVVNALMNREKCNKDERTLTPVENVDQDGIDEIQNKGDRKSSNDNILRHSQGRNPPYLPPLDTQSVKLRNSDSQVISPQKEKEEWLVTKVCT